MFIPTNTYQSILESLPILCVDVLIVYEGKCLLLLRDNEPAKGTYWFPGGRVYKNELIKDAVVRKAKEEVNLVCEFVKIVSVEESLFEKKGTMLTDVHTVNVCCLVSVQDVSGIKTDRLHSNYIWVESNKPAISLGD